MLRGINQQQIFEEAEDYTKFLEILKHYEAVSEYIRHRTVPCLVFCKTGEPVICVLDRGERRVSVNLTYYKITE